MRVPLKRNCAPVISRHAAWLRLLACVSLTGLTGCASLREAVHGNAQIAPFKTDGCSLFPDGDGGDKTLWMDCCIAHDKAYWQGGTRRERREADEALRDCVLEKTGDAALAETIYDGVRMGGSPIFPTWYRWGYGWPYVRQYRPLSPSEREQVDAELNAYDARTESSRF